MSFSAGLVLLAGFCRSFFMRRTRSRVARRRAGYPRERLPIALGFERGPRWPAHKHPG